MVSAQEPNDTSKEVNLPGYQDGEQWTADDGTTHTVNSTNDPNAPGGYYHTQVDSDGTMADVKANRDWE